MLRILHTKEHDNVNNNDNALFPPLDIKRMGHCPISPEFPYRDPAPSLHCSATNATAIWGNGQTDAASVAGAVCGE